MPGLYDTDTLLKVVADLRTPPSFLLDLAFRETQESTDEFIHFDIDESKPRITPYVSPLVAGKVVTNEGFVTKTFKPAYVKDKRSFQPKDFMKRAIGEKIGGELSPDQREQLALGRALANQLDMLTRREEVQAAEALRLGQITVAGDGFPTQVVSFGRHADLRDVLTGNHKWSVDHADSNPIEDIEQKATEMQTHSGAVLSDVVLAPDAYTWFRERLRKRDEWKLLVDSLRASVSSNMDLAPGNGEKARYLGTLGVVNYWVYDDVYVDPFDGATKHVMPSGEVLLLSKNVEGVRAYGCIQDVEAKMTATRYFPKSWIEPDPSVRWLMLQSAPLMVPYRINACASLEVLNG
jgi:hypothetical protein